MKTIYYNSLLTILHCSKCGVPFGLQVDIERSRRNDHDTFYCTNGHGQCFPQETEEERLKKQLNIERQKASTLIASRDQLSAELRDTRETSKREKAALKGSITKMKNRVGRGVCPCCNRYFADVHKHMESKHPGFSKEEVTP